MKIDFHTHTKLAKKMPFSQAYTDGIFCAAKEAGLDAICLTEHYNGADLPQSFDYIDALPRRGDAHVAPNGLLLFPGLEINAAEGGHFLAIGAMPDVRALYGKLAPYLQSKTHPPFDTLADMVNAAPLLFGVSHPYRENSPNNRMPDLTDAQLKKLDFLDCNGKDTAHDKAGTEAQLQTLSRQVDLPILAGSDTHQTFQFGCIYNVFDETHHTVVALWEAVAQGAYRIEYGAAHAMQVRAAGLIKSALKAVHALGGDYVTV